MPRLLAENGADVAFTYQSSAGKTLAVATSIEATGHRAAAIHADSANPKAITRAVSEAVARSVGSTSSSTAPLSPVMGKSPISISAHIRSLWT